MLNHHCPESKIRNTNSRIETRFLSAQPLLKPIKKNEQQIRGNNYLQGHTNTTAANQESELKTTITTFYGVTQATD